MSSPRLALVVPTLGRVAQVERLLQSIRPHEVDGLEVIVVDQNDHDQLVAVIERAGQGVTRRLQAPSRGASAARNAGASAIRAPYLCFPDDDAWLPEGVLRDAVSWLDDHPDYDVVAGRALGADGRPSMSRWWPVAADITRSNVTRTAIEFTTFFRSAAFATSGGFDEGIGPGSGTRAGAWEVTDLLLRMLARGSKCRYEPSLHVHHDDPKIVVDAPTLKRARTYGFGMGLVLRRHRFGLLPVASAFIRPIGGAAIALAKGDTALARYRAVVGTARVRGWLAR